MSLYMVSVAYFGFGSNLRLSVSRCGGVESKEEGRCR